MLAVGRLCYAAGEPAPSPLKAPSGVSALVAELQSDNASNRLHAARALVAVGPSAVQALAHAMGHGAPDKTRSAMIDAFVSLGSEAVPMMLALIRTEQSWELRHNPGLDGILRMGTNALPGLAEALRAPEREMRGCVIDSLLLLQLVPGAEKSCVRLLIQEAKTDQDEKLRIYAADALGYLLLRGKESVSPEARDGLHELLEDKSPKVRITAAYSLAKAWQESSPKVLAELVEGLNQSDADLAYECVFAMNFLESNTAPALPELSKALQRGEDRIASEAANVLAKLGDPGFPPLSAAAADSNPRIRLAGLNALPDLVIKSTDHLEAALDILTKALKAPEKDTRQSALDSLRRIGVERQDPALVQRIIPILTPLMNDGDKWVRLSAENALKELSRLPQKGGALK
jgi:HEAT repeat protein